ncbi:copper resistance CopC family protein [uncultured Citricoccus sp.]|uniref:copper resistance CopC family protein n=1 Tax=uncultured Citricoccus sp. TaxID=614031 RepID=UPI002627877D|nr:copper resistance CopC family protein [uncultured Citricoccus sp.]
MPILAVLAALVLALLGPLSPAAAHDVVTGTNPSDGQALETAPEAIEVSFSNTPLALGAVILVEDAQGADWTTGEVQIDGNSAAQPLRPDAPAGEYTVTWRVVSSDSHPIEGSFDFTVTGTEAPASPSGAPVTAPAQPVPTASEPSQAEPTAETGAEQPGAEEPASGFPVGFVIVLAAILALALVIVVATLLARRRAGATGTE